MAIKASAIWRVRPHGNNSNGGGYDGITYPGGTDYSQQDTAQATWASGTNGLTCTGSASTTLTDGDARGLFTPAMVGNAIQIAGGTGFTAGFYFITQVTDANNVVLDRTPASSTTAASAATGYVGGGWATIYPNVLSLVAGNILYVLGGSSPSYASPDYATTGSGSAWIMGGNVNIGPVTIAGDPATPTNNGYGGRPVIVVTDYQGGVSFDSPGVVKHIWFALHSGSSYAGSFVSAGSTNSNYTMYVTDCVFDYNGRVGYGTASCIRDYNQGASFLVDNCEFMNSGAAVSSTNGVITANPQYGPWPCVTVINCKFKKIPGVCIQVAGSANIFGNVFTNCGNDCIQLLSHSGTVTAQYVVSNNTFDGLVSGSGLTTSGNGISVASAATLENATILNNVFSNFTVAGTHAILVSGTGGDGVRTLVDYNTFYNNASDLSGISYGPHDTSSNASAPKVNANNPFVDQPNGDYTLTSTYIATGYPQQPFLSY